MDIPGNLVVVKGVVWKILHPAGLFTRELRLQDQSVFNKHTLSCRSPDVIHFERIDDDATLSGHVKFDFRANGPKVCSTVELRFEDFGEESRYCHRVHRKCACKHKKRTVVAGDIIIEGDSFLCILFFCYQGTSVPHEQEEYGLHQLTGHSNFIFTFPDCAKMGCGFGEDGRISHKTTVGSIPVIALDESRFAAFRVG